ncbi:hypothetical protein AQUCO_01400602v1 [Aquilegia coerulea]|uniref:EF-hand domain-containing protein n=1 Tax=Aquilegia coerulea TaxID=218851 RepID=A0A2G5DY03_AQUCA|nr:hypothetical protein AQUCO_01400602v1 [Aquilegia coerulea]
MKTWFQLADRQHRGFIDDKELQIFLSTDDRIFSLRTVHLLMYDITNTNIRKLGIKEFSALVHSIMNWKEIFERVDRNRSRNIDSSKLQEALLTLGCTVPPVILDLLVSNFAESGGDKKTIEYDSFIGCCLTVKRLQEKLREKDTNHNGSATFTCESFISTVLYLL